MKIIGHRGAKGLAPENTLASFQKALDHQVDEIECDAHVTADRVVVLAHNPFLHDVAGNKYRISQHSYQQLKQYRTDLATLSEAVALVNRRVPFMIEIKPGVSVEPILEHIKTLHRQGWTLPDITIASESYKILKTVRQQMPELELSIVEDWSGVRATWRARRLGVKRLSMNYRSLWSGFAVPLIHRGYVISAYTVNKPRTMRRLQKYGVQAIFTDVPDIFQTGRKK